MVQLETEILQAVEKPARYVGHEWNAVKKNHTQVACSFALALPDVYEVGMSNLGLAILYEILNRRTDTVAERVYAPWIDFEKIMREKNIPLFSLETREEIRNFSLLGFSLQYEMIFSNVLNMLDLAGIPLLAVERSLEMPFVVGGGPCVYNVEPIVDFFDFFIIGEGEEVIGEVVETYIQWKQEDCPNGRRGFLQRLLRVNGIYVPSFYRPVYDAVGNLKKMERLDEAAPEIIFKRVVKDMDRVLSVEKPVVPYMDIVHKRIMLELFRGCSRGCRFCQAGMCYRPARERREKNLRVMARNLVDASGYEEMSLTSLSSADYSCLGRLVDDLMDDFKDEKVSFSLPSLRIDSFSIDLAHKMQQVRKSGLTFAPEAGTQRLRDVINKGVTEENLLTACAAAFRQGWKQVKLYFMMGLPTETDEDIIGIAQLAKKVVDLFTKIKGKRGVKVTVSVSCFVPKPYTPFQWFGQIPLDEFVRKQKLLKEHITDKAITFNYHDAHLSVVEGAFARGDRRLNQVLLTAWKDGARFDGWSDFFHYDIWESAFKKSGVDMTRFNERTREIGEMLPWAHTSPGVTEEFLRREWKQALVAALTEDCRRGKCSVCGICQNLKVNVIDYKKEEAFGEGNRQTEKVIVKMLPNDRKKMKVLYRYRAKIQKGTGIRFVSHLDYTAIYIRAFVRAHLPVAYSEGFNPHMKIAFGSALAVGVTSEAEYMDFELKERLNTKELFERINKELPVDAKLLALKEIKGKHSALMAQADLAIYRVEVPCKENIKSIDKKMQAFQREEEAFYVRITPKKTRKKDVKRYLDREISYALHEEILEMQIGTKILSDGSIKPGEILTVLKESFALAIDVNQANIHRIALTGNGKDLIDIIE